MNHLHKFKTPSLLKWVSSNFPRNHLQSSKSPVSLGLVSMYIAKNSNFYTSRAGNTEKDQILEEKTSRPPRVSRKQREAQSALLENLHGTRNLPFTDAEHMSKNCPVFINKLLNEVESEEEIGRSLTKFFRYNPINEFEPFFESMGFTPSEVNMIIPRNLIFLKDDPLLLENYHTLCNYGIPRSMIGKFYKEAVEVFRYDHGVLCSKLQAYVDLGLTQSSVIKVMASSPSLLIGTVNTDFVNILDLLKSSEIEFKWIEGGLSDKNCYDWSHILGFLSFICEMGYDKEELEMLIKNHTELLLDGSGRTTFYLVGFLLKLGSTRKEIASLLLQFPRVQLWTFVKNLRECFIFLMEIDMDAKDIGKIVCGHPFLLGSCFLKKSISVLANLNVGKKRLCNIIKEDPYQLKNWILGVRVQQLPNSGEDERSLMQKTEFLLNLGLIENSDDLKKALKVFRGKGGELQERFDCFLKAGLDRKDAIDMIKRAPQVLNQKKEVIEQKIDFLVNVLHYPITSLVAFPSYTAYTVERVKLRFSMYTWLRDEGVAAPNLNLSTVLACSEKLFTKAYVRHHPRGLEVWENLKKEGCI